MNPCSCRFSTARPRIDMQPWPWTFHLTLAIPPNLFFWAVIFEMEEAGLLGFISTIGMLMLLNKTRKNIRINKHNGGKDDGLYELARIR